MSVGADSPTARSRSNDRLERRVHFHDPGDPPPLPNTQVQRSSAPAGYWGRTSFKLTKPKPSKTKYLTKQEMCGILLSVMLSCLLACFFGLTLYIATPVVLRQASNFLEDMIFLSNLATGALNTHTEGSQSNSNPPYASKAPLRVLNLTSGEFLKAIEYSNQPLLVNLKDGKNFSRDVLDLLNSNSFQDKRIDLKSLSYYLQDPFVPILTHPISIQQYIHDKDDVEEMKGSPYLSLGEDIISHEQMRSFFFETEQVYLPSQDTCSMSHNTSQLLEGFTSKTLSPLLVIGKHHAASSGSPFHFHVRSLSYLVQGTKRWVFLPPDSDDTGNPLENLQHIYPTHSKGIEIIQQAGQWVFIPEGQPHATQTLSPLSISLRFSPRQTLPSSYYHYLREGDRKVREGDLSGASLVYKLGLGVSRTLSLLIKLADAMTQLGQYLSAEELYREVLRRNPNHVVAYAKLIKALVVYGNRDVSESISALLAEAQKQGVQGDVLKLAYGSIS